MGKAESLDEVLEDALRVAAQFDLVLDPGAVLLTGRAGLFRDRSRWPGWGIFTRGNRGFAAVRAGGHPGGFCLRWRLSLARDAPDGLAIHPDQALDFSLATSLAQQRFYRNS